MYKSILLAATLLASSTALANDNKIAAGIGFQYGGALGVKYSFDTSDQSRFFISAGLVGGAVGYEYAFSEKNALTFSVGSEAIASEKGFAMLEYGHYFQGRSNSGWKVGGGIGIVREDQGSWFADYGKTDTSGIIAFNLGYQF